MWYPPATEQNLFLRRHYPHQVKGSKFDYFLSACFTSSPVFISFLSIHRILQKTSGHPIFPAHFIHTDPGSPDALVLREGAFIPPIIKTTIDKYDPYA